MATIKQLHANRLNALKSTGPRTEEGKLKSRLNAVRHGLTAETVIAALEDAEDYKAFEQKIAADYSPTTAIGQELVARLASVLWRLRRSTRIEYGLLQIQAELMRGRTKGSRRPQWYDELMLRLPEVTCRRQAITTMAAQTLSPKPILLEMSPTAFFRRADCSWASWTRSIAMKRRSGDRPHSCFSFCIRQLDGDPHFAKRSHFGTTGRKDWLCFVGDRDSCRMILHLSIRRGSHQSGG